MRIFAKSRDLELEERVRKLEGRMKDVEMEWETWYEKARRLMWRLTKRQRDQHANEFDEVDPSPASDTAPGRQLDPISAKILARRAQRGVSTG